MSVAAKTDLAYQRCISPDCGATYGVDEVRVACDCAATCSTWPTTGTGCSPPPRSSGSKANGRGGTSRFASAACGGSTNCCRSPRQKCRHHRRRANAAAARNGGRQVRRPRARPAVPAVRGHEPLGQLQRQRHDGRVHARPHGRRQAGRLRLDRQHQRLAGRVLLGDPADEGRHLHRLGQDLLRQAVAGARLRRADGADRRRLRRRHGTACRRSPRSWASTWSTASIRSGWKGRRRSCSACSKRCAGKCPTGSSCPAATWATPAPSARRSSS